MNFAELRTALLREHLGIHSPFDQPPSSGWWVVVCPSEYHPEGWAITVSRPHRIINHHIASCFERTGFSVQWSDNDCRMEAWPR